MVGALEKGKRMARDDFGKRQYSTNPYWNLGAEIIRSAIMADDVRFLCSDWCADLEKLMGLKKTGYEMWFKRRHGVWPQNYKK